VRQLSVLGVQFGAYEKPQGEKAWVTARIDKEMYNAEAQRTQRRREKTQVSQLLDERLKSVWLVELVPPPRELRFPTPVVATTPV
jgi:hypothetical protein